MRICCNNKECFICKIMFFAKFPIKCDIIFLIFLGSTSIFKDFMKYPPCECCHMDLSQSTWPTGKLTDRRIVNYCMAVFVPTSPQVTVPRRRQWSQTVALGRAPGPPQGLRTLANRGPSLITRRGGGGSSGMRGGAHTARATPLFLANFRFF